MQDDKLLEQIESILPELTTENIPLKECSSTSWWQIIQNEYYNNELLLKSIVKVLEEKYHKKYSKEELLYMQKLYLLYPNKKNKELLSCPWEIIKILINILEEEKRIFYLKLYLQYKWSSNELIRHITNDLYEKYVYTLSMINDYNTILNEDIIQKLLNMEVFIYKKN